PLKYKTSNNLNHLSLHDALPIFAAEAQNHPMPRGKPGWAWQAAARALVLREVLLREAKAQAIAPEPIELEEGKWEVDEEALIRQDRKSTRLNSSHVKNSYAVFS